MTLSSAIGDMAGREAGPAIRCDRGVVPAAALDHEAWVNPGTLAGLVTSIGCDSFFEQLLVFVCAHVPIDNCVVVVFTSMGRPLILHQWSPQEPNYFKMMYAQGAYQLDPFYLASLDDRRDGVHCLSAISPDNFEESDFFETYYRKVQMRDEIGLLVPYDRHLTLHLSLGRRLSSPVFTEADLEGIRFLEPLLRAVLLRHCGSLIERALHAQSTSQGAATTFATMLADRWAEPFGVTMREAETAALILRGHSNTSIGLVLDISPETVKVHRKNLYAKLRISSPTELFMLFINQMMPLDLPPIAVRS